MANTFSGLSFSNVAQKGLAVFSQRLIGLNIFTTNFSADLVEGATAVLTRVIPAATTPVTKSTTAYNDSTIIPGVTTTLVTVPCDHHYVNGFNLTDKEMSQIASGAMEDTKDKMIEKHINGLADYVMDNILADITVSAFSTAHTAINTAVVDNDDLIDMRTKLAKANFPISETAIVVNSDVIGSLLKDSKIASTANSGLSAVVDGAGAIVRLAGMKLYEAPNLPTNSENLVGFTCTPDALAIAMKAPRSSEVLPDGAYYEILSDPMTGATLGYYAWFDGTQRQWVHNFECQWGSVASNAAALYRIVSG